MLAAGNALPVVSARLGHARVSTTLNVYAASMPAWDRAAAETMSSLLRQVDMCTFYGTGVAGSPGHC
jgi:integrase